MTSPAWAVGEASTRFELYVPPNNETVSRAAMLIVTAVSDGQSGVTTVNIADDGADGDTDDSVSGLSLSRGQSRVVYLKDGAINDDFGGKSDGDLFEISANAPVIVQMATKSDWQHDWMPADNKTMVGEQFYIFAADSSTSNRDLNVFALGHSATVKVSRISTATTLSSATSSVNLASAVVALTTTLSADCDLMTCAGLGVDLMQPGHTYLVEASAPVSVVTGSLANLGASSNARDGGGFVPSQTGGGVGKRFVFSVPHDPGKNAEQEIRIVSFGSGTAALEGYDSVGQNWSALRSFTFAGALTHGDVVGTSYELFRLTSGGPDLTVFEGNWLETGAIGTSDIASFVPALGGYSTGTQFLAYVPPPGRQSNVVGVMGTYAHVTAYARQANTTITVVDDDTNGATLSRTATASPGAPADVLISSGAWNAMNNPSIQRRPYVKVTSDKPIALISANYNDNWQTFAPGIIAPSPLVDVSYSGGGTVDCSTTVTVTTTVNNPLDEALSGTGIVTSVPNALAVDGALEVSSSGLGSPTITTGSTATTVTYAGATLGAGASRTVSVDVHLPCGSTPPSNGALVTVRSLATGTGTTTSDTYATQESSGFVVQDTRYTQLAAPSVSYNGSNVPGTFVAVSEASVSYFEILRASSPTGTPSVLGGHIASLGNQTTGRTYSFTDSTASVNQDYYYWVRATGSDSSTTLAGPTHFLVKNYTPPPAPTVTATAESADILLGLSDAKPVDFAGYRILRAVGDGPFTTLVIGPLNASTYTDASAVPWITYRYKIEALNTSGTVSADSNIASASIAIGTTPTPHVVMFEDRLGMGENDWDFNDFVAGVDVVESFQGSNVSAYDLSIEALARGAHYTHAFRYAIPANGAWTATVTLYTDATAAHFVSQTSLSGTGTIDLPIFADTRVAIPPAAGQTMSNTVPGEAFVDGQLARVHVTLGSPASNPGSTKPAMPYDPYLRLIKPNVGNIHMMSPTPTVEIVDSLGTVLDGAPIAMALAVSSTSRIWATESTPMWNAFQGFSDYALTSGGDAQTFYSHPQSGLTISKGGQ